MVTKLQEKDQPQAWFKKKTSKVMTTTQKKAASKIIAANDKEDNVVAESNTRGRARAKAKPRTVPSGKGRKKGQNWPTATADVVVGRTKNPVLDVEELRRKREEDAAACGRVIKTISNAGKQTCCPTTTTPSSDGKGCNNDMVTCVALEVPERPQLECPLAPSTG